jgi:prevent-host-death family protein
MQASQIIKTEDAGAELAALVDRVEHGQTIVVTRGGVPVARIEPARFDPKSIEELMERARTSREKLQSEGRALSVEEILAARDEGRR